MEARSKEQDLRSSEGDKDWNTERLKRWRSAIPLCYRPR